MPMDRTSTFCDLIKNLSNKNFSEIHALESLFDDENEDLDNLLECLDNLKTDVREEVVQKIVKFAREYREKVLERENVK
jgi:Mor family transcriptional regulator